MRRVMARQTRGLGTGLLAGALMFLIGYLYRLPCRFEYFAGADNYRNLCYTDVPALYLARGIDRELLPGDLEYPVGIRYVVALTRLFTAGESDVVRAMRFFDITAIVLGAVYLGILWMLRSARQRWLLVLSPLVPLLALINWDLVAVFFVVLALYLSTQEKHHLAGVALGLGTATKLFPVVITPALVIPLLRQRRFRDASGLVLAEIGTWILVNLPLFAASPRQWSWFFRFNSERGADWGSLWLVPLLIRNHSVAHLNLLVAVFTALALAAAVVLIWRRQLSVWPASLLLALSFLLFNKVYSPQYALWLLPLAVLSVRTRSLMLWQIAQIQYVVAIWFYLQEQTSGGGIGENWYAVSLVLMWLSNAWLAIEAVSKRRKSS